MSICLQRQKRPGPLVEGTLLVPCENSAVRLLWRLFLVVL